MQDTGERVVLTIEWGRLLLGLVQLVLGRRGEVVLRVLSVLLLLLLHVPLLVVGLHYGAQHSERKEY